ncbi:hypothetical protein [Amylibacter marinus]|nr:hypothetical protein [Amylibacter marinus]
MRDNEFGARLKRIETQHSDKEDVFEGADRQKRRPRKKSGIGELRERVMPWVYGFIGMLIVGILVLEIDYSKSTTPPKANKEQYPIVQRVAKSLVALPKSTSNAVKEQTGPRIQARTGYRYSKFHSATTNHDPVEIARIWTGFKSSNADTPIDAIKPFQVNDTCQPRRPDAGEKVINVILETGGAGAPVQRLNHSDVIRAITKGVDHALDENKPWDKAPLFSPKMAVIDVSITDRSAPLYLVLQNTYGAKVWNIHAAEGVNIAHIVMIGHAAAGITGNIGKATFETLRGSDQGHGLEFHHFSENLSKYDCMTTPVRRPDDTWSAWSGSKTGNTLDGNLLYGYSKAHDAYAHWYRNALGVSPELNMVSASLAHHALIGEVPKEPLAPPANTQATWHIPVSELIYKGTDNSRASRIESLHNDLINAASAGDILSLTPRPIDLGQPPLESLAEVEGGLPTLFGVPIMSDSVADKVDPKQINYSRRITISATLPLETFLTNEERRPDAEVEELYVKMRAPRYMMRFCADTVIAIARKCGLVKTHVRKAAKGYRIRATFGYVPNYFIGRISRYSGDGFLRAFLPDTNLNNTYETPEKRQAFLKRIARVCEQLRAEFGNCVIGVANFDLARPSGYSGSAAKANAAGWVEIHSVDNPFEERLLAARAMEIFEQK